MQGKSSSSTDSAERKASAQPSKKRKQKDAPATPAKRVHKSQAVSGSRFKTTTQVAAALSEASSRSLFRTSFENIMQVLKDADPEAADHISKLKQMKDLGCENSERYKQCYQELASSPVGKLYAAATFEGTINLL